MSLIAAALSCWAAQVAGQEPMYETVVVAEPEPGTGQLEPVAVSRAPGAGTDPDRSQRSVGDALVALPGVWSSNRENYAQDLRLSVRGFGDRAAFGVRGIRVFVDGVPYTLPDGQTTMEDVDPGEVAAVRVVRGPTSAFYGNAGGGALLFTSMEPMPGRQTGARLEYGSFHTGLARMYGMGQEGRRRHAVSAHWQGTQGWRERSQAMKAGGRARFWTPVGDATELGVSLGFSLLPVADDPGGLSQDDLRVDRRQASSTSLSYGLGERATLGRGSLSLHYRPVGHQSLKLVVHGQTRHLDNAIPRRYVFLERYAGGLLASYQNDARVLGRPSQFLVGLTADAQLDHRRNLTNEGGRPVEPVLLDEDEDVLAGGLFASEVIEPWPWLALRLAGRLDRIRFAVDDAALGDGDQSGSRAFTMASGFAGLAVMPAAAWSLYANLGQSYETPTASELTMRPGGGAGINPDLEPQRALSAELGARLRTSEVQLAASAFHMRLRDELLRFEDDGGRAYFRNAGRSHRDGGEAGVTWQRRAFRVAASYTFLRAVFDVYQVGGSDWSGNRVPGLPRHRVGLDGVLRIAESLTVGWLLAYVHPMWADDANQVRSAPQWMTEARAAYRWRGGPWDVDLFVAARNVAGQRYEDNVRINAIGGRFFEPAPPLSVRLGLAVTHRTPPAP